MTKYILAFLLTATTAHAGVTKIESVPDAVSSSSAAATYVNKAGDTMTGALTVNANIISNSSITTTGGLFGTTLWTTGSIQFDSSMTAVGLNSQTIGIRRRNNVAATSEPGVFEIRAPNASGTQTIWGALTTVVTDATAGTEDADWELRPIVNGAATATLKVGAAVTVGSGSGIARILKTATASTDLGGAITANCTAETNFSITGVAVGDACVVTTPAALASTDWIVCRTLADNVALKYCTQGAAVDPAAMVFHITTIEY